MSNYLSAIDFSTALSQTGSKRQKQLISSSGVSLEEVGLASLHHLAHEISMPKRRTLPAATARCSRNILGEKGRGPGGAE